MKNSGTMLGLYHPCLFSKGYRARGRSCSRIFGPQGTWGPSILEPCRISYPCNRKHKKEKSTQLRRTLEKASYSEKKTCHWHGTSWQSVNSETKGWKKESILKEKRRRRKNFRGPFLNREGNEGQIPVYETNENDYHEEETRDLPLKDLGRGPAAPQRHLFCSTCGTTRAQEKKREERNSWFLRHPPQEIV